MLGGVDDGVEKKAGRMVGWMAARKVALVVGWTVDWRAGRRARLPSPCDGWFDVDGDDEGWVDGCELGREDGRELG